jgi:hypothetical protein
VLDLGCTSSVTRLDVYNEGGEIAVRHVLSEDEPSPRLRRRPASDEPLKQVHV